MNNKKMKGFTIVELVIVIAIIAILAAILIPTFASIIDRANESSDIQAARQMNSALAQESVLASPSEIDSVIIILGNAGYNTQEKLRPVSAGYNFYWYKTYNQILLVEEAEDEDDTARLVYPTDNETLSETFGDDIKNSVAQMKDTTDNGTTDEKLFNLATFTDALLYSPVEKGLVSGGVVTLMGDEEISNTLVLTNNTTLDLNGQTLTINGNGAFIIEKNFDIVGNGEIIISEATTKVGTGLESFAKALFMNPMLKESSASIDLGINALFTGAVSKGSSSTMDGGSSNPVSGRFTIKGGRLTFGKDENDKINLKLPGDNIFCIKNNGGTLIINQCKFTNVVGSTMTVTGNNITVFLKQNIEMDKAIEVAEGKNVTIDGNDVSLTAKFVVNGNLVINNITVTVNSITIGDEGRLTANNATINCAASILSYLIDHGNVILKCVVNNMDVVKNETTREIKLSRDTEITNLTVAENQTVTINLNGMNLIVPKAGITVKNGGTLEIIGGGRITATDDNSFVVNGTLNIGATEKTTIYVTTLDTKGGIVGNLTNCEFVVIKDGITTTEKDGNISITISGDVTSVNIEALTIDKPTTITISEGKTLRIGSITINNSLSITGGGTISGTMGVLKTLINGNVTIEECAFKYEIDNTTYSIKLEKEDINTATITLDGTTNLGGLRIDSGKTVTIESNNDTKHEISGAIENNGTLTITDCTVNAAITINGTLNLDAVTVTMGNLTKEANGTLRISNSIVNVGKSPIEFIIEKVWTNHDNVTYENCTFTNENISATFSGDVITATVKQDNANLGIFTIASGKEVTIQSNDNPKYTVINNNSITNEGTLKLITLTIDANSIPTGGTVTLDGVTVTDGTNEKLNEFLNRDSFTLTNCTWNGMDVNEGKTVTTINLNGETLSLGGISFNSNLEISNGTITGTLSDIVNNGKLTLNSCTYGTSSISKDANGTTITGGSIAAGNIPTDGTVTLEDVTVTGSDNAKLIAFVNSNSLTLTNCNWNGISVNETSDGTTIDLNDQSLALSDITFTGKLTISNGTITGTLSDILSNSNLTLINCTVDEVTVNKGSNGISLEGGSLTHEEITEIEDIRTLSNMAITVNGDPMTHIIGIAGGSIVYDSCTFKYNNTSVTASINGNEITLGTAATLIGSIVDGKTVTISDNTLTVGTVTVTNGTLTLEGKVEFKLNDTTTIACSSISITDAGVVSLTGAAINYITLLNSILESDILLTGCTFRGNSLVKTTDGTTIRLDNSSLEIGGLTVPADKTVEIAGTGTLNLSEAVVIGDGGMLIIAKDLYNSTWESLITGGGTLKLRDGENLIDPTPDAIDTEGVDPIVFVLGYEKETYTNLIFKKDENSFVTASKDANGITITLGGACTIDEAIEIKGNVSIDLNGKKLTITDKYVYDPESEDLDTDTMWEYYSHVITISDRASLSITDSESGDGLVIRDENYWENDIMGCAGINVNEGGTLNISGVAITGYRVYDIINYGNLSLGSSDEDIVTSIAVWGWCGITNNGPAMITNTDFYVYDGCYGFVNYYSDPGNPEDPTVPPDPEAVKISGGSFVACGEDVTPFYNVEGGTITVNGTTFTEDGGSCESAPIVSEGNSTLNNVIVTAGNNSVKVGALGKIIINGGTFTGKIQCTNEGIILINGATFKNGEAYIDFGTGVYFDGENKHPISADKFESISELINIGYDSTATHPTDTCLSIIATNNTTTQKTTYAIVNKHHADSSDALFGGDMIVQANEVVTMYLNTQGFYVGTDIEVYGTLNVVTGKINTVFTGGTDPEHAKKIVVKCDATLILDATHSYYFETDGDSSTSKSQGVNAFYTNSVTIEEGGIVYKWDSSVNEGAGGYVEYPTPTTAS